MPVSYTIEKGYAYCKASGNYSFEETYNNHKSALDDPRFLPGYNLLVDVFDSKETRTYAEMQQVASLLANHPKFGKKYALVVNPEHTVRYGLGRMLSTLGELRGVDISIFFNIDDAKKFLEANQSSESKRVPQEGA
jgi:hypothetical protein